MQQSYPYLYVQRCLLKDLSIERIMKISPSMIENMPVDGCLSVDCILLMYFCGVEVGLRGRRGGEGVASSMYLQPLSHVTSDSNFRMKFTNVFSCMATYFNLVPCKLFENSPSLVAPLSLIVPYFSLALFKSIFGKQFTKKYTLKNALQGALKVYFQGALKQSDLEPADMFYRKQKLAGLSQKYLTFRLHVLFYAFYEESFLKQLENYCTY